MAKQLAFLTLDHGVLSSGSNSQEAKFFQNLKGAALHVHPSIILIWQKYVEKDVNEWYGI